ncbi:hypothetical protein GDO78_001937 [Eleutherodactylus coqui]|uniref:Uncharacterized protein n=1 Tax=Eleutherodactylus coqui TaxID=57060 RepID=A0A8J6KP76_ELECQ|nr:hypothetical protein GDO78_001937 [Eleutherodactylus coqui]
MFFFRNVLFKHGLVFPYKWSTEKKMPWPQKREGKTATRNALTVGHLIFALQIIYGFSIYFFLETGEKKNKKKNPGKNIRTKFSSPT